MTDREFVEAFSRARVSKTSLARYILRELEHVASPKREEAEWVNADPQQITLEHILPRTLPSEGWEKFKPESHVESRTLLGNLCLLKRSENNGMPNDSFDVKRTIYGKSSFKLTSDVADSPNWSPQVIAERQRVMALLALKAWPSS